MKKEQNDKHQSLRVGPRNVGFDVRTSDHVELLLQREKIYGLEIHSP